MKKVRVVEGQTHPLNGADKPRKLKDLGSLGIKVSVRVRIPSFTFFKKMGQA